MSYVVGTMPKKVPPASKFAQRLFQLRSERGLTQMQLAQAIGSSQRALSRYETVADFPPASVIIELAKALDVSTDELLGLRQHSSKHRRETPEQKRLWKKFLRVLELPEKDRRAIIRMINSLTTTRSNKAA